MVNLVDAILLEEEISMLSFNAYLLAEVKTDKHIVFAFGRMNPPTSGHEQLVRKIHSVAATHKAAHVLTLSRSQDPKKNPLSPVDKLKHAKRAFPKTNINVATKEMPAFVHHVKAFHKAGFNHLHMVAGSDRIANYHKILHTYNGRPDHWKFKSITMHSSGARDPDSDGVDGISASKMREHAKAKNYEKFKTGAPSGLPDKHVRELYNDVNKS